MHRVRRGAGSVQGSPQDLTTELLRKDAELHRQREENARLLYDIARWRNESVAYTAALSEANKRVEAALREAHMSRARMESLSLSHTQEIVERDKLLGAYAADSAELRGALHEHESVITALHATIEALQEETAGARSSADAAVTAAATQAAFVKHLKRRLVIERGTCAALQKELALTSTASASSVSCSVASASTAREHNARPSVASASSVVATADLHTSGSPRRPASDVSPPLGAARVLVGGNDDEAQHRFSSLRGHATGVRLGLLSPQHEPEGLRVGVQGGPGPGMQTALQKVRAAGHAAGMPGRGGGVRASHNLRVTPASVAAITLDAPAALAAPSDGAKATVAGLQPEKGPAGGWTSASAGSSAALPPDAITRAVRNALSQ
jgi:hypothetical protein